MGLSGNTTQIHGFIVFPNSIVILLIYLTFRNTHTISYYHTNVGKTKIKRPKIPHK